MKYSSNTSTFKVENEIEDKSKFIKILKENNEEGERKR